MSREGERIAELEGRITALGEELAELVRITASDARVDGIGELIGSLGARVAALEVERRTGIAALVARVSALEAELEAEAGDGDRSRHPSHHRPSS